jgi:hypothetical protein
MANFRKPFCEMETGWEDFQSGGIGAAGQRRLTAKGQKLMETPSFNVQLIRPRLIIVI